MPAAIKGSNEAIDRITKIVKAVKDFSHVQPESKEDADINNAITNTLLITQNEWKYDSEIKTKLDQNLPLIKCCIGEIKQVILNLIINASHSIQEAKANHKLNKGIIEISTSFDDESINIYIADNGIGIPQEIQHKIFNPFFTTKKTGKGTGQGLTLSHSIITKQHKGLITFETEEGKGTTFCIKLPRN